MRRYKVPEKRRCIINNLSLKQLEACLEERQTTAFANCSRYTITYAQPGRELSNVCTYRLPCKSWYCPRCAPRNLKRIRHRLREWTVGRRWRFVTLTTASVGQDIGESLRAIVRSWHTLSRRITRAFGKFAYCRVVQFHHNGLPHLHLIVDCFIPQKWLSTQWNELHGSPIVDIRSCKPRQAVNYITRYMFRSLASEELLNIYHHLTHTRRYATSRPGLLRPPKKNNILLSGRLPYTQTPYRLVSALMKSNRKHGECLWMLTLAPGITTCYPYHPDLPEGMLRHTKTIHRIVTPSHPMPFAFHNEDELALYLGVRPFYPDPVPHFNN